MVDTLNGGLCRDSWAMEMVCRIAFICAVNGCTVRAKHISGISNPIVDALSRHGPLSSSTPSSFSHSISHSCRSDECLTATLCGFEKAALAVSTQAVYTSGERVYKQFCERYCLALVPASEETLMYFAAHIAKEHAVATVRSYLAAVRSFLCSCAFFSHQDRSY